MTTGAPAVEPSAGVERWRPAVDDPVVVARFVGFVHRSPGCWWWTGALSSCGHGRFWVRAGLVVIAHRFAYALAHPDAALPEVLAHTCDESSCQKPAHLAPSDPDDNRAQWVARRSTPGSPLRDTRGARGRAAAVRAALRTGGDASASAAAGAPAVDAGQGSLW
ncbi:hypothetical protein EBM89_05240 [Cellulomonas triticagri]|uniref:HNH endonuclease n=1 Tax=Cellulomonas triticagri TaxID=2483352 RepID=A0A3M2JHZ7_9CELL|nr:hypothetical protein EBM89_05240 [Cellulomonas triticagri]